MLLAVIVVVAVGVAVVRGVGVLFGVALFDGLCFLFLAPRCPINLDRNLVRDLGGGRALDLAALTSIDRDSDEMVDGAVVAAESSMVDEASLIRFGSIFEPNPLFVALP